MKAIAIVLAALMSVALVGAPAWAHCGSCPGDKKCCPADCKKDCCKGSTTKPSK